MVFERTLSACMQYNQTHSVQKGFIPTVCPTFLQLNFSNLDLIEMHLAKVVKAAGQTNKQKDEPVNGNIILIRFYHGRLWRSGWTDGRTHATFF